MIKLGLSIYEDDSKEDDDLPPLAEAKEGGAEASNKMEEVDWHFILNN